MANERPNLIVVIIQITNERGFFSCLIRVEFINRSKNGGPRELSLHFDTFSIFLVPLLRIYPARTSSSSLVLFLRGDSFFPPYSFYFLHRWCICIYIMYIYMYIYSFRFVLEVGQFRATKLNTWSRLGGSCSKLQRHPCSLCLAFSHGRHLLRSFIRRSETAIIRARHPRRRDCKLNNIQYLIDDKVVGGGLLHSCYT